MCVQSVDFEAVHHDQAADPKISRLRVLSGDNFGNADKKHHVVLQSPERQGRCDYDSGQRQPDCQHALPSWGHVLSPSAFTRTSMSL